MTLEILDRSIFEHIRLKLVSLNYLPDFATISGNNESEKQENYEVAKQNIVSGGGQVVDIYSFGTAESKDVKESHRIVISRKEIPNGTIGTAGQIYFEPKENNRFVKKLMPERSSNVVYEVRIITNLISVERKLIQGIREIFGQDKYIQTIDEDWNLSTNKVRVIYNGSVNVSSTDFIEWLTTYTIRDIWIDEPTILNDNVPPINTINISLFEHQNKITEINIPT